MLCPFSCLACRLVELTEISEFSNSQDTLLSAQDQFILEWGRLSSSWGINRTMAQIHALLLVTGRPHSVDEIIERLQISRGNASMNLRNLMDWGIVQRFRRPGDRKDIYLSENDPWQVFSRVIRERKRREIDPTEVAIRDCIAMVPESDENSDSRLFRKRLQGLLEIFELVDAVYDQVFKTDQGILEAMNAFRRELES